MKKQAWFLIILLLFSIMPGKVVSETKEKTEKETRVENKYEIPSSVINTKENTYPNPAQDLPKLQPSRELTEELLQTSKVKIENPNLLLMLNETVINKPILALGYRPKCIWGTGRSIMNRRKHHQTGNTKRSIRIFMIIGADRVPIKVDYCSGTGQSLSRGGLTAKVAHADDVQQMMLREAMEKTKLPLSFETIIGPGTKKDQYYNIPGQKLGYLDAYAPAINEKRNYYIWRSIFSIKRWKTLN